MGKKLNQWLDFFVRCKILQTNCNDSSFWVLTTEIGLKHHEDMRFMHIERVSFFFIFLFCILFSAVFNGSFHPFQSVYNLICVKNQSCY